MKTTLLVALVIFFGGYPKSPNDKLINDFDTAIQARFASPPDTLGMSRVATPASMGHHFVPAAGALTDFKPQTPAETAVLRELAGKPLAFYVFGAAVTHTAPQAFDFRALKGPAVATTATKRADVPRWAEVYPFAVEAMKRFERGERCYDAKVGDWQVTAKAVPASSAACVGCHNRPLVGRATHPVQLHEAIGGVLYLSR